MRDERPSAAIDVGSNTVRLLIGRLQNGKVESLQDESRFVRLGLGVDSTHNLQPDREQAALAAIAELTQQARSREADPVILFATSAVRDAENSPEFVRRVEDATGLPLVVLSGEREAELTYLGATMGLEAHEDVIVCDLGGGSAELIYASAGHVRWATSQPLGSGRLTERFVRHDPPAPDEQALLRTYVTGVLEDLSPAAAQSAVFTGGTATHMALMLTGSRASVDITVQDLRRAADLLNSQPAAAVVDRYGFDPERARVLPAGSRALQAVAEHYGTERITISRSGIREGAILSHFRHAAQGK